MKKFLFFAILATILSSCSRLVGVDYELLDQGVITKIENEQNLLTINSFKSASSKSYCMDRPKWDKLSVHMLEATKSLTLGDTVYIYQDGTKFLASKYSIADAKNINETLCAHYWQLVGKYWYFWIILIIISVLLVLRFCQEDSESYKMLAIMIPILSIVLACVFFQIGYKLHFYTQGKVTQINAETITLNNSMTVPLTSMEDIKTQKPVKIGQEVYLYQHTDRNHSDPDMFISTQKLNESVLQASQTYPERLLKTFFIWILSLTIECIFLWLILRYLSSKESQS